MPTVEGLASGSDGGVTGAMEEEDERVRTICQPNFSVSFSVNGDITLNSSTCVHWRHYLEQQHMCTLHCSTGTRCNCQWWACLCLRL